MKMGHCLLIFKFNFPLLPLMLLLLLCEKCVQETTEESQTPGYPNNGQVPKSFPVESLESDEFSIYDSSQVGFPAMEPFNKSVFVIPITGILLVITMVLLYIFYTWNLSSNLTETSNNEMTGGKPWEDEDEEESSEQNDGHQLSPITDFHALDYPPSYLEATTKTHNDGDCSSNPPTYSSVPSCKT